MRLFWGSFVFLSLSVVSSLAADDVSQVPVEAVLELGTTTGEPQMNGFVFVEGRYLAPPYTVTRRGTGLFVNRVLVDQPTVWRALETEPEKHDAPQPGDSEGGQGSGVAQKKQGPSAEAASVADVSIDDLFTDDKTHAGQDASPDKTPPGERLEGDSEKRTPALTPEVREQRKIERRNQLDRLRLSYEQGLARGELYFFSQRHNRVNGNYGTARALMEVLPKALRAAESPQDLLVRLNQGGVYFIDLVMCAALYENKLKFPLLEARLRKIKAEEEREARKRWASSLQR